MSRAPKTAAPNAPAGPITPADCARVRKERDRHVQGGGAWQAWDRILDLVELHQRVQAECDAAMQGMSEEDRDAQALPDWLAIGGTL